MITFHARRSNPINDFKTLFFLSRQLSRNKFVELQAYRYNWYWINVDFECRLSGCDHAGLEIDVGVFGYCISFYLYDTRHWDDATNDWVKS